MNKKIKQIENQLAAAIDSGADFQDIRETVNQLGNDSELVNINKLYDYYTLKNNLKNIL